MSLLQVLVLFGVVVSIMADDAGCQWLGRQDSNLGMQAPKARALPLGYAPDVIRQIVYCAIHGVGVLCRGTAAPVLRAHLL